MKRVIFGSSVLLGILMWGWMATGWTAAADGPRSGPSEDVKLNPSIRGSVLYNAYCASCHGPNAKGGGPMAKALKISPADLTRISTRNGGTFPLARISRIISGEEQVPGGHGTREMPVWGPIFSHVDSDQDLGRVRIDNLARYLRELQVSR